MEKEERNERKGTCWEQTRKLKTFPKTSLLEIPILFVGSSSPLPPSSPSPTVPSYLFNFSSIYLPVFLSLRKEKMLVRRFT